MSLDISSIAYAMRARLNRAHVRPHLDKVKLTHIQECIAAALHHNTLASLQSSGELKAPTDGHYLLLDMGRVRKRALALGLGGTEPAPDALVGFEQIMLECFAKEFNGIEVFTGEKGLYEAFHNWFESRVLNDVLVSRQIARASYLGAPDVSHVDLDFLGTEHAQHAQARDLEVTIRLKPSGGRKHNGDVVKVDVSVTISKPSRALFGFHVHIGGARLASGPEAGQGLPPPEDNTPGDEPQRLEFALVKLLDVNLASADELAEGTLNAKFDASGDLTGYVFDFNRVELDQEEEERLRGQLPDLTLHVTPAWVDNLMLDRKRKVSEGRQRYFVHGDQTESNKGQYCCKVCDLFAGSDHFMNHPEANLRRYDEDMGRWHRGPARWKLKLYRPHDPENLFAGAGAPASASSELTRSGFHRWLEGQTDRRDPVGDLARDVMDDRKFPCFEAKRSELLRYLQRARASGAVSAIFLKAWAEYERY